MNDRPIIEELPSETVKYEYSGESTRNCCGCGIDIEEGETVVLERFKYNGKLMSDTWHPQCWEDAEILEDKK